MPNDDVCVPVHEKLAVSPSLILSECGRVMNAVVTHGKAVSGQSMFACISCSTLKLMF